MDKASEEKNLTAQNEALEFRWPRYVAISIGAGVFVGGLISFLGWLANIPRLTDWDGTGISIQPNTTINVMAAGAALLLAILGYRRYAAALAILVALIGFTALVQNITHADLGINTVLMFDREWGDTGTNMPGLMGFPGSISWTLVGTSLLLFSVISKRDHPMKFGSARGTSVGLAMISMGISLLSLIGFLYGAKALYTITAYTAIAFQTAIFILAVSLGIVLSIRETGPMSLFADRGPAGILARRLVPTLIILPILIGGLRLIGEQAGYYDLPFGSAMRTVVEIGLLLTIVGWAGVAVNREARRVEVSQSALRQLADAMPQVVWMSDSQGLVEYYNSRAADFAGIRRTRDGKYDWQPGIHPDDLAPTLKSWQEAVEKLGVYAQEHRILMADGTFRWHLSRAVPAESSDGGEPKWFGTATDIHDLKMADNALRESEQRFASFMQNLPGLAWIKDRDGRYVFANEAAQVAFGKTDAELYGKTDVEIFPAETAAAFVENDRLAMESENSRQTVEQLIDNDGTLRFSLVNKFPIHINGEPAMIGGMATDVTEQKVAQENQEFLFRVADKIRAARDAEELLAELAEELGVFLGVHRCLFNEVDIGSDIETVHGDYSRTGESVAGRHRISEYSSLNIESMASGNTVVNHDSKNDPRTADYFEKTYGPSKELAYIAVPMMREGRWVASLWCSDDRPRDWSSIEIALVENIAERVWAAVERLRSAETLRFSEEKYHILFESMDEGYCIIEVLFDAQMHPVDYRFIEVNSSFERQAGMHDVVGKRMLEFVPAIEPHWLNNYGKVALTGEGIRFSGEYQGLHRYFDVYAFRAAGWPERYVAVLFADVSERKRADETMLLNVGELERFNRAAVGRELRMIELKKEINEMCRRTGETEPYPLEFLTNGGHN